MNDIRTHFSNHECWRISREVRPGYEKWTQRRICKVEVSIGRSLYGLSPVVLQHVEKMDLCCYYRGRVSTNLLGSIECAMEMHSDCCRSVCLTDSVNFVVCPRPILILSLFLLKMVVLSWLDTWTQRCLRYPNMRPTMLTEMENLAIFFVVIDSDLISPTKPDEKAEDRTCWSEDCEYIDSIWLMDEDGLLQHLNQMKLLRRVAINCIRDTMIDVVFAKLWKLIAYFTWIG